MELGEEGGHSTEINGASDSIGVLNLREKIVTLQQVGLNFLVVMKTVGLII